MANVRGVVRQRPETTILDLPNELITYICRSDALKLNDVFNLAASHPKFNDCLFREPNSYFWKSKYLQKYTIRFLSQFELLFLFIFGGGGVSAIN